MADVKHKVPFFSQKTHILEVEWQPKGCGVTALKMIMEYWKQKNPMNISPQIPDLIATGLEIKSYVKDIGWSHQGLVNLAYKYGYGGYHMDLSKINTGEAWQMLKTDLDKYPVMVSVYPHFDAGKTGGHIVTLTGLNNGLVSFNDPEEETEMAGSKTIPKTDFLKGWKQRYIIIKPKK